jgi:hypothetical protein
MRKGPGSFLKWLPFETHVNYLSDYMLWYLVFSSNITKQLMHNNIHVFFSIIALPSMKKRFQSLGDFQEQNNYSLTSLMWDCMVVGLITILIQSVPITTKVVSLNPIHDDVCSIQHYVIKVVSDLHQVGGFLWVLRFPPPIQLTATK